MEIVEFLVVINMGTIVDITDVQITADKSKKGYKSAFGIWKEEKLDSLAYQQELRKEWDR